MQHIKKSPAQILAGIVQYVLLTGLVLLFLTPLVLLFLNAFKDKDHVMDVFYLPALTYIENFKKVFAVADFIPALLLTMLICVCTLTLIVLFSAMAGYTIHRSSRKWIKVLYFIFVAGQIIPTQTSMIPIYQLGVKTGMINTLPFLILIYVSGGVAFASIFFTGFSKTIPRALEESASIDGCSYTQTFFRIIFPLLKPASLTIICTTVYWYWNDFQGPLIYLNQSKMVTLMMTIYRFKGANSDTDWGPVYALCLLSLIPMVVFFLLTQKKLMEGMVLGSVKG